MTGNLPKFGQFSKKGDKAQAGNYRPVSLTSIICKVMETFIKNCLYDHLITHYIILGILGSRPA